MVGFAAAAALVLGVALYWLLVTTEGAYLGRRIVVLLYDWTAARYNAIKGLDYVSEVAYLGAPLSDALQNVAHPMVLDVAAGTGRVYQSLAGPFCESGLVVGLDGSERMLRLAPSGLCRLQGDAERLPFNAGVFDAVCCIEALEFVTHADRALEELIRVLRPGGVMLLSNRVGRDAWFFPGKLCGRGELESRLARLGCHRIRTETWQTHYDLVWAEKRLRGQA